VKFSIDGLHVKPVCSCGFSWKSARRQWCFA